ncbi:hypothetical protein KIW84_062764 [Lathyrus oleraceus]|uniref:Uncharacterized protein n=1 Tax=Pisum sativum TaxID=3888 RepID=A0A9D4W7R5_PEA|nr:hypothetical protein KIW84_062764 [Pisum sativum]
MLAKEGIALDSNVQLISQCTNHNRLKWGVSYLFGKLDNLRGTDTSLSASDISSHSIMNDLAVAIQQLREIKLQRMQNLQNLATTMLELSNLMDTPIGEQQNSQNVTWNIAASEHEITEPNTLSADFINCGEVKYLG